MSSKRVFISYRSAEHTLARELCSQLSANGHRPWLDLHELGPGSEPLPAIAAAIKDCDLALILLSPDGLGRYQEQEIKWIHAHWMDHKEQCNVVPILLPMAQQAAVPLTLSAFTNYTLVAGAKEPDALISWLRLALPGTPQLTTPDDVEPYVGLRAFTEGDARFYCGRDGATAEVLELMRQGTIAGTRFVSVIGPSGSGKSSLVHARVVPAIRARRLDGSFRWRVIQVTHGGDPLRSLAASVVRALQAEQPGLPVGVEEEKLSERLTRRSGELAAYLRLFPQDEFGPRPTLLVIDQFEWIFTILSRDAAIRYIEDLRLVATARDIPVHVLIVLRADFSRELFHTGTSRLALARHISLRGGLSTADLDEIIESPARRVGYSFDSNLATDLKKDFASLMSNQTAALPLLQFVLQRLWEERDKENRKLTFSSYKKLGGLEHALESYADESLKSLTDEVPEPAVWKVLSRLFTSVQGTVVRVRLLWTELASVSKYSPRILNFFIERRILQADEMAGPEAEPGAPAARFVELSHEILLRAWGSLHRWVRLNADALRRSDELQRSVAEWRARGKPWRLLWPLAEVEKIELLVAHGDLELNTNEREFIKSSSFKHKTLRVAYATALVVASGLVFVFYILVQQSRAAEQGARLATNKAVFHRHLAEREANRSVVLGMLQPAEFAQRDDHRTAALLLALRAYQAAKAPEAQAEAMSALLDHQFRLPAARVLFWTPQAIRGMWPVPGVEDLLLHLDNGPLLLHTDGKTTALPHDSLFKFLAMRPAPGGSRVVAISADMKLFEWDGQRLLRSKLLPGFDGRTFERDPSVILSRSGAVLATNWGIYDLGGDITEVWEGNCRPVDIAEDDRHVLLHCGDDGHVVVSMATKKEVKLGTEIAAGALHPHRDLAALVSEKGALAFEPLASGKPPEWLAPMGMRALVGLQWIRRGEGLIAVYQEGYVVCDLSDGRIECDASRQPQNPTFAPSRVLPAHGEDHVVIGDQTGSVALYGAELSYTASAHDGPVSSAMRRNGLLITAGVDGYVLASMETSPSVEIVAVDSRLSIYPRFSNEDGVDIETGKSALRPGRRWADIVEELSRIADELGPEDGAALRKLLTGEALNRPEIQVDPGGLLSPEKDRVAIVTESGSLRVIDTTTYEVVCALSLAQHPATAVLLDGQRALVLWVDTWRVQWLDVAAEACREGAQSLLQFSDKDRVHERFHLTHEKLYDSRSGALIILDDRDVAESVCQRVGRNLTRAEWSRFVGVAPWEQTCANFADQEEVSIESLYCAPEGDRCEIDRALFLSVLMNPARLTVGNVMGYAPGFRTNEPDGWIFVGPARQSIAGRLGFISGDVLQTIDGNPVGAKDFKTSLMVALASIARLQGLAETVKEVTVDIRRNGRSRRKVFVLR